MSPLPTTTRPSPRRWRPRSKADVAILALGEPTNWMEGEAASRAHLGFTGNQEKLLEAVVATGKPVILVVLAGRPLELKWAAEHVPAILEAWSPGIEAGPAVADVLFGDVNPSGKLPSSFPRAVGQEPLYYAQMPTGRPAHGDLSRMPRNAAEKFVSRYVDEQNSALFPFGWGLSYTRFSYAKPTAEPRRGSGARSCRRSQAGDDGGRRCEEHRQRGGNRSGAALHSQHRSQRGAAGARVEGLRARISLRPARQST